jgi:hypothetical protein
MSTGTVASKMDPRREAKNDAGEERVAVKAEDLGPNDRDEHETSEKEDMAESDQDTGFDPRPNWFARKRK